MRAFFSQLRTRLIIGAVVFLLALTGAVGLVVRDSLLFAARNTARLVEQGLLDQGRVSLLEIARREAELSDQVLPHDLADLAPLHQRLRDLRLAPNTYVFVVNAAGQLVAASPDRAGTLFGAPASANDDWLERSLLEAPTADLRDLVQHMQAGQSGTAQMNLGDDPVIIAYAPLPEAHWALGLVAPVTEITAGAKPLGENIQGEVNNILQATLLTIGYFAALAVVGVILVAGALTRPIQTLVAGTRAIAAGDLSVRLPVKSSDELGLLADSFNSMTESLQKRSVELLKVSSAVEQTGDLAFITNRAGVIEYVNLAFETLTGFSKAEALGQTPRLLKSGAHADPFYQQLWATILAGEVFQAEVVNRKKNGETYIEEKTISPIKDAQGQITHFVSTGRDITQRKQAENAMRESEERLRLITEVTTDALYEWDVAAGTTQWNHSYRTLFGYPTEGAHEHKWWRERVHPDDLAGARARLETAFQSHDKFISFEYRYRRADGSYAHVIDRGFIFYDEAGQPIRQVGAMIDITDRVVLTEAQARAALEERQRLARELHDSVTQSLYSLTLLAEASRRIAVAGDLERVISHLARLGETAQQALKEMRLLVYELRPLALEAAGLVDALQHRLDAVEKRAGVTAHLRVDLEAELPLTVENGLYRIAQEALTNALKHSGATAVTVSLLTRDQRVELEVADNGQGFDVTVANGSGGLGLVSIRERAEALGGEASFFSQAGEGTCVRVSIPLGRP